jgi:hypothetical protein
MFVIEVLNPDGPHWFGGIVRNEAAFKAGHDLPMNLWSPYKEDAKEYAEEQDAQVDLDKLKDVPGAQIVQHWKAKFHDSRRLDRDRPHACVMRARYLQEGEVFIMSNTYYIVTSRNAEEIHYGYADLNGIYKGGNFTNGPAGIMSAINAYWVTNIGHKSILIKSKTEAQ